MKFELASSAFAPDGDIPKTHTCDGEDDSPPLAWSGAPGGTRSFALIVDDPDAPDPKAPRRVWTHWVVYNLPVELHGLRLGMSAKTLPKGALEGFNDSKRIGWEGPCPSIGRHRYFFKLFALDTVLPDLRHPTRTALEKAMEGHVLAHTELVGHFERR